jgi:hypothetical protein
MTDPQPPQQPPQQPGPQPPYPGGYPPPPPPPYAGFTPPPPPTALKNGLGIAALVVGIIALISVFGGVVLGVVAVILVIIGLQRARRGEANNGGVAIAGVVLGVLSIIVSIVAISMFAWFFAKSGGGDYVDCLSEAGSDQQAVQRCADQFRERVEDEFGVPPAPTP